MISSPQDFDQIIAENETLIHHVIQRLGFVPPLGSLEYDDYVQWGRVGLWRAARGWDPARGAWGSYAATCIRHEIFKGVRRERLREEWTSLDAPAAKDSAATLGDMVPDARAADAFERIEWSDVDWDQVARTGMTPTEYRVWRSQKQRQAVAAKTAGISQSLVSRYRRRVHKFWRQWYADHG